MAVTTGFSGLPTFSDTQRHQGLWSVSRLVTVPVRRHQANSGERAEETIPYDHKSHAASPDPNVYVRIVIGGPWERTSGMPGHKSQSAVDDKKDT